MSAWLNHLHWQEPLWLLLSVLPWLALTWRKQHQDRGLGNFADPPLLQWLLIGDGRQPRHAVAVIAAWTLAALAAAGPYWQPEKGAQRQARGADIMVIVDISPSMAAGDLAPSRLDRVKRELRDFTALLGSDRLGLVAFSANAYAMLPLTADHDAFLHFVDLLDPSLTERPGTNLARALAVAGQSLRASAKGSRALVLLSDGEDHDPGTVATARRLVADQLPLFVIGAGTAGGAPVPDSSGHFLRVQDRVMISHLDRHKLEAVAAAARGSYFDLSYDDSEWHAMLAQLRARTRAATHGIAAPAVQGIALYPWLLAASLVLFMWSGVRRREGLTLWLLPLLLIHPGAGHAAPWSEQQAYDALQQGEYAKAQQLYGAVDSYNGQLGLGVAAYRRGDWQTALVAFKGATAHATDNQQKARALYNTGNALAQLHRFEAASNSYRAALRLQPDLAKAGLNLSLVNQFLDARRGMQQRKDADQPPSPALGAARRDAPELDRQSKGKERNVQSEVRQDGSGGASSQPRPGSQAEQQTPGTEPPPQHQDNQRLQQALALWQDHVKRRGAAPELDALKDDSTELLRYRFMRDDRGSKAVIIEGKPW